MHSPDIRYSLFEVATGLGRFWWLVLVYPLAGMTFGLLFSRTRAFCEHVIQGRPPDECFVRTHLPNRLDAMFFYTLNMNYHVEHHLFPRVPWWQLPRVHEDLRALGYFAPGMVSGSILHTVGAELQRTSNRP